MIALPRTIALTIVMATVLSGLWVSPTGGQAGTPAASPVAMTGTAAVFMTIGNAGAERDRLVGGSTDAARAVEIHEMAAVDGMMRMRPLPEGLEIPAGGEVTLEPGGLHVMLVGLTRDLENGAAYELTLEFEREGDVTLDVPVQARAADGAEPTVAGDLSIVGVFTRPAPMVGETMAMTEGMAATPAATPRP